MGAEIDSPAHHADVAQLVEHNLAKVGVAGSNPVVRSKKPLVTDTDIVKSARDIASTTGALDHDHQ